jgi:hypothetical protein
LFPFVSKAKSAGQDLALLLGFVGFAKEHLPPPPKQQRQVRVMPTMALA